LLSGLSCSLFLSLPLPLSLTLRLARRLPSFSQQGTGKWTVQDAADRGVPLNTVAAALNGRFLSSLKAQRQRAAAAVATAEAALTSTTRGGDTFDRGDGVGDSGSPSKKSKVATSADAGTDAGTASFRAAGGLVEQLVPREDLEGCLEDALLCCKLCSYAQGLALIATAAAEKGWSGDGGLDLAAIVRTWQGGCIIRATLLASIEAAFVADPVLPNLLLDPGVRLVATKNACFNARARALFFLGNRIPNTRMYPIPPSRLIFRVCSCVRAFQISGARLAAAARARLAARRRPLRARRRPRARARRLPRVL
jgi:6-phosphogluconate dehydrogenase